MKRKFINVTKKYIEDLAPTDFCVELIQPAWETVNIYGTYEEYEETLKPYTIEQRYLLAMHWLGAEVANGGFQQFLSNSTAIVWEDVYKGYQAMKKILSLFDGSMIRFIIVGVINTVIGTVIMFGMYNLLGINYWISTASNYILVSILSYYLNKHFTFKNKEKSLLQVVKFALNIAFCYLLAYGIAKPVTVLILSGQEEKIQTNIAMLVGMVFFTGFNYLGQRFFAFKSDSID